MAHRSDLEGWFRDQASVLLGYSGGVDSAVLAVVGTQAIGAPRFLAAIGRSASLPEAQWRQARDLAATFDVPLVEVSTGELDDPGYRANAPNRCYYCKSELWARLGEVAIARGIATIIDGTNVDDQADHRPGAQAGTERQIRSPYLELGWSKADVRQVAREAGLPIWDAPAAPCLASRIRYGLEVTEPRLRQVELAEELLRTLGVIGDLRVRHLGDQARIEVGPAMFPVVVSHWPAIEDRFVALGFQRVELDPAGYRRGNLLPLA